MAATFDIMPIADTQGGGLYGIIIWQRNHDARRIMQRPQRKTEGASSRSARHGRKKSAALYRQPGSPGAVACLDRGRQTEMTARLSIASACAC